MMLGRMPGKELQMNANEVVRALHMMANEACVIGKCGTCPLGQYRANIDACDDFIMEQAAALIESLQAQLTKSQRRERAAVEHLTLRNTMERVPCISCKKSCVDSKDYYCRDWVYCGPQEGATDEV